MQEYKHKTMAKDIRRGKMRKNIKNINYFKEKIQIQNELA
jgi:hypothetical protein